MKLHTALCVLLLNATLTNCGGSKNTVDGEKAVAQQEANAGFSTGKVTTAFVAEGCAVLIELDGKGKIYLLPIALEEKYKRNGLRLKFKYQPSRATSGECRKGTPAVLEEVSVLQAPASAPKDGSSLPTE